MTSSGDSTTAHLNRSLPNYLECNVCSEYLTPPISQCKNGHSVCTKCSMILATCPLCRKEVARCRNRLVKQLANMCPHSCYNPEVECQSKQTLKEAVQHVAKCLYRTYECEIGGEECNWKGLRTEIRAHVQEEHDERYCEDEVTTEVITEFEYHNDYLDSKMIFLYGEIFIMYLKITAKKLYGAVKYIGVTEKAKKFIYEFDLCSRDGCRRICHRYNSHPDYVPTELIFKSQDCFMLDKNIVNKFIVNDALHITIRIGQV